MDALAHAERIAVVDGCMMLLEKKTSVTRYDRTFIHRH
jgi:hypothetical protein